MGITALTSPCHECKPKSHEHWLGIPLRLCLWHHGLVIIMHGGPFICMHLSSHTRIMHAPCLPLRLIYIHIVWSRLIVVAGTTASRRTYTPLFLPYITILFLFFRLLLLCFPIGILFGTRWEVYRCILLGFLSECFQNCHVHVILWAIVPRRQIQGHDTNEYILQCHNG
jgi:hypothetical protein